MPIDPSTGLRYEYAPRPTGGVVVSPFQSTGRGANDPGGLLSALYTSRPQFLQQQRSLLSQLGPSLRQALFQSVPEIAQLGRFLTERFAKPIPASIEQEYASRLRAAQAARGFTGGGTGPAGEEARFLTQLAENQRQALVPQLAQFGQGILGNIGLAGPPDISLGGLAGFLSSQNALSAEQYAARQRSTQAARLFGSFSPETGFGGGGIGGTGSQGGGGTPDFFARQSSNQQIGTPDFFARQSGGGGGAPLGSAFRGGALPTYGTSVPPSAGAALQGGGTVGAGGFGFNTGDPSARVLRGPAGNLIQAAGDALADLLSKGFQLVS